VRPVSPNDLTTRYRLRQAALRLFAEHGFEGTSTRAIAEAAGVSPALVTHHFGSKEGLREAVNEDLLTMFGEELAQVDVAPGDSDRISRLAALTARLFGEDQVLRWYLRRLLLEGSPASVDMLSRLLEGTREELNKLAEVNGLRSDVDRNWAPFQILFLLLGPLLLEPVLATILQTDLFDPAVLSERSDANRRMLLSGLLSDPQAQ
jgi:AcrR family transcriptional regulator